MAWLDALIRSQSLKGREAGVLAAPFQSLDRRHRPWQADLAVAREGQRLRKPTGGCPAQPGRPLSPDSRTVRLRLTIPISEG
jgi:hypothetical protein